MGRKLPVSPMANPYTVSQIPRLDGTESFDFEVEALLRNGVAFLPQTEISYCLFILMDIRAKDLPSAGGAAAAERPAA